MSIVLYTIVTIVLTYCSKFDTIILEKHKEPNSKYETNKENIKSETKIMEQNKQYNLEERSYIFARDVRELVKKIPRTIANIEDGKQLVRSSGSIAANYIEANEALSKKDFLMRIKIARKEAKETGLWLRLLDIQNEECDCLRDRLVAEAKELLMILSSIMRKVES